MKKSFLLATVLVSNIVFASVLPSETILVQASKLQSNSLSSMAALHLRNRGLDYDVAQDKIRDMLGEDELTTDLMAQNFVNTMESIALEDVVNYISDAAIFSKNVDLSSYATLVSITQKKMGAALSQEMLSSLETLSSHNEKIKKLSIQLV